MMAQPTGRKPLYGLVFGLKDQAAIIERTCFGTCGKIIVGAVIAPGFAGGELAVCRTPSGECPAFDKELDQPISTVDGDPLYIRKLK